MHQGLAEWKSATVLVLLFTDIKYLCLSNYLGVVPGGVRKPVPCGCPGSAAPAAAGASAGLAMPGVRKE